jgi:hypothetical protein
MFSSGTMLRSAEIEPASLSQGSVQDATRSIPESNIVTRTSLDAVQPAPGSCVLTGENCEQSCAEPCQRLIVGDFCPSVYVEVEALGLQRVPRLGRQTIVEDFNSRGAPVISTSDVSANFVPGIRVMAGIGLDECRRLEFGYMGLFDSNTFAEAVRTPGELLKVPDPLGAAAAPNVFRDMDYTSVTYGSVLRSFELNLLCCRCDTCCSSDCCSCNSCSPSNSCGGGAQVCSRSFEWFVGLRYINLEENLDLWAEREERGGTETGQYGINARNNLYGAQCGASIRRGCGRLRWEATGKVGIYGNDAYQSQYIIDYPDFELRPWISAERGLAAFAGELNLSLIYKLNDVWGIRGGYNLMWIEGLALAPNQLDFTFDSASGSGLNSHGGLFLHGVNLGLEARW